MQGLCTTILAAALSLAFYLPAFAETKLSGVSFDIMPIGCRIHGSFSNGDTVTRDYIGPKAATYVVKSYSGKAGTTLKMTTTLNANGFAIRNDMPDGNWETYTPYSCLLQPGTCEFTTHSSDGRQRTFRGKVIKEGQKITTSGGYVGEAALPISQAIMGRFNTMESMSNGDISFRVIQYEACESSSGTPFFPNDG